MKNNYMLKATIALTLFSALLALKPIENVYAEEPIETTETYAENILDVTTGWEVDFKTNLPNIKAEDVFRQGLKSPSTPQKMVLNNFGNIGNAELVAERKIPMKKGHTYTVDLIYGMKFSAGMGYIDFNGEKVDSDSVENDARDHSYVKTITPDYDMEYTITMYFKVPMRATGYLKLAFDTDKGNGIDDKSFVEVPVLNIPTEGDKTITGTGINGNTINIYDANKKLLGSGKVNSLNQFSVEVNRPFVKNEVISGFQVDKDGVISQEVTTIVKELMTPNKPELPVITEESTEIKGKSDPNTTVIVHIGNELYETLTDPEGNFSIILDHTFPYGTEINAVAKNEQGNLSEPTNAIVEYAQAISVDFDYVLTSIDNYLSGTSTRPNTDVEIKVGARIFHTTTDEKGNYAIELPTTYKPGTKVSASITDKAGKTAVANQIVLPRMPTFASLVEGSTEISGLVDPNASVKIKLNLLSGEEYEFETTADLNGNYRIVLKTTENENITLVMGDKVTAQATLNDIGLSSEEVIVTILSFM